MPRLGATQSALTAALAIVFAVGFSSCGSEGSNTPTTDTATSASDVAPVTALPYALLEAPGWTLEEAVDPNDAEQLVSTEPITSEWFADYQELHPVEGGVEARSVLLTGIPFAMDAYRLAMERSGASFETATTAFGPSLVGTTDEAGAHPWVVAVPLEDGVLQLLSYELDGEALLALVPAIDVVDAEAWRAAGGR